MSVLPPVNRLNAMLVPSGDHSGSLTFGKKLVICVLLVPLAFIVNRARLLPVLAKET
jgi:hypothetical protein